MKNPDFQPFPTESFSPSDTQMTGAPKKYACPRHATPLQETHSGKLRVWHCATCSGLWLPAGAFHSAVGHVSVIGRGRPAGLSCPADSHPLTAVRHRGIEVDVCGTCGGIWFDHGELQKILSNSSNPAHRFLEGNSNSGISAWDVASVPIDVISGADLAGDVLSAIFDFLSGLSS